MKMAAEKHGLKIDRTRWILLEAALDKNPTTEIYFRYKGHKLLVRAHANGWLLLIDGDLEFRPRPDESATSIMREVWRKRTRAVWSATEKARMAKSLGGLDVARETYRNFDKVSVFWNPAFPSAKAVISRLAKLPSVELLEIVNG